MPASALLDLISPELLEPLLNVIRASLHPLGLSRYIVNFGEYAAHVIERLDRQLATTSDPGLAALLAEVTAAPTSRRRCGKPRSAHRSRRCSRCTSASTTAANCASSPR
ncbi:MAG: hypothetical protein U0W40_04790 [Acidimicrobiia bacterium]